MAIIELSDTLREVLSESQPNALTTWRLSYAECRIKIQIGKELIYIGTPCTQQNIDKIYHGIPKDKLDLLLAYYS